ncbi:hypothetical protein [Synechococcus sp. 8F6]|uniref:hypothetical protein n=1 Tax=Synechococcus sp. 8F6 TaxID=2025606 RepID=UPI00117C54A8|nr:hypothetical protein [Synechococcus sp. 8F6]
MPFFFFIFLDSSFNFGDGISRALEAASEPISELVSDALSVSFSLAMDQHILQITYRQTEAAKAAIATFRKNAYLSSQAMTCCPCHA